MLDEVKKDETDKDKNTPVINITRSHIRCYGRKNSANDFTFGFLACEIIIIKQSGNNSG